MDLSEDMLRWQAARRPPCLVASVTALPLASDAVDDAVAAFVLNHLPEPGIGLAELGRVTRAGGAVLASVFANSSFSAVRELLDDAARGLGWTVPQWYSELRQSCLPILGTADSMSRMARQAGLVDVHAVERPVDIGVTEPEQLVSYRLGQAQFTSWLDAMGEQRTAEVSAQLVEAVRPVMTPYRPVVLFLSALVRR